ncbi:hypothetical protein ACJIZ3_008145 [Penstemon smallii]|uniref:Uncharacterized protein n=1 Tax=Penstemon smallii TaxID=265156 RepID=A0ABD3T8Y0_9LAMI
MQGEVYKLSIRLESKFFFLTNIHVRSHLTWFNPFRGGLGTLSGYLSQYGFEPESATL